MGDKRLFGNFAPQTKDDWLAKAKTDLKDKPLSSLESNWAGLKIEPYYANEDFLGETSPIAPHHWINYVKVKVTSEAEANKTAKKALNLGATGIIFDLSFTVNYRSLLAGIEPTHCAISFTGKADTAAYLHYIHANKIQNIHGFVDKQEIYAHDTPSHFYPTVIKANAKEELSALTDILLSLYKILLPVPPDSIERTVSHIAYELNMGTNYFLGIAKLRALRMLLHNFYRGYGLSLAPEKFHLIVVSTSWKKDNYQPHENMLKATTAAMAGIIGGCDALIIDPGYDDEQEVLVARNISSILEFEAYLGKVADPSAGSYFIEQLTKDIKDKVWQEFNRNLVT